MEKFVKGDVVIVPFPFSDLSSAKRRPTVIVATLEGNDLILCQITSEARYDKYSVALTNNDFKEGGLHISSMIRPNRIFTAEKSLILYKAGCLRDLKVKEIQRKIIQIFSE